jgi:hypothetical protein
MRPRHRWTALLALSVLLAVSAGCKKDKTDDASLAGAVAAPVGTVSTTAAATEQAPPSVAPWTGTVSIDYGYTFLREGGQFSKWRGSIAFTDLVRVDERFPHAYSAVVSGSGINEYTDGCADGSLDRRSKSWEVSGRVDPATFGPVLDIRDEVDIDTGKRGSTIWAEHVSVDGEVEGHCPSTPGGPAATYTEPWHAVDVSHVALTPERQGGPLALVPDDDPSPDHLVGSVTYTVASPPYRITEPIPSEYRYTITYDLVRQPAGAFTWTVDPGVVDDGHGGASLSQGGTVASAVVGGDLPVGSGAEPTLFVRLDGCANPGATSVTFTVDGIAYQPAQGSACRTGVMLSEGAHTVTATVTGGSAAGTTTETIDVVHHVIVGLGDSYGSGEGIDPPGGWADLNCRRSGGSPQARAAKTLEESDDHSAVTFVFLACSGATTSDGVRGAQLKPPGGAEVEAQLSRAVGLTNGLVVDRVLLSIGGNDIGFSDIIMVCAQYGHCPMQDGLHSRVQDSLALLRATYISLARAFTASGLVDNPAKVLHSEYPAIATEAAYSRADTLQSPTGTYYCDGVLRPPFPSGIADEELAWASQVVQDGDPAKAATFRFQLNLTDDEDLTVREPGLNTLIRSAPGGFTPVVGAGTLFDGHGYCAPDESRYIAQLDEVRFASDKTAPMHPNLAGQQAWGQLIADVLVADLAP